MENQNTLTLTPNVAINQTAEISRHAWANTSEKQPERPKVLPMTYHQRVIAITVVTVSALVLLSGVFAAVDNAKERASTEKLQRESRVVVL